MKLIKCAFSFPPAGHCLYPAPGYLSARNYVFALLGTHFKNLLPKDLTNEKCCRILKTDKTDI